MKFKFNPLTGEFNLVPDSGTLKQKLNWLTGNFNLTKDAGKYKQIYNVIEGEFNLYPATTQVVVHGTGSVQLTNTVKNGLLLLTAYGGTEQRNLPSGYTEVEYLESSGTQYIDLGYKGNGNTKVEVKFKYHTVTSATGSGRVFGSRITLLNNAFAIGTSSGVVASTYNKIFWCYDGQPFYVDNTEFGLDVWNTVVFSATEHTINGVTVGDDYEITEFETPSNLSLFAFDNNGTIGIGYVDIAYCKLWNNGVLVRDLIPCKNSSNVFGMYDRVSETLLTNAGTGTFTAGPNTVPTPTAPMNIISNNGVLKPIHQSGLPIGYTLLDYIQSGGSNYIDTGIKLTNEDIVEMQYLQTADKGAIYGEYYNGTENMSTTLYGNVTFYFYAYNAGGTATNVGNYDANVHTVVHNFVDGYIDFDGVRTNFDLPSPNSFTNTLNCPIFGRSNGSSIGYFSKTQLYYFRIRRNGTLILDLIPAKDSDNNVGMYDRVSGTLFTESGTGSFIAGNTVSDPMTVYADGTNETIGFGGVFTSADGQGTFVSPSASTTTRIYKAFGQLATGTYTVEVDGPFELIFQYKDKIDATPTQYGNLGTRTKSGEYEITDTTMYYGVAIRNDSGTGNITPTDFVNGNGKISIKGTDGNVVAEMLLKVGNYADEQEILSGDITRKVGIKVLDGTESWFKSGNLFYASIATDALEDTHSCYCTHFKGIATNASASYDNEIKVGTNVTQTVNWTRIQIYPVVGTYSSGADLKQWLADQYNAGTPVIIVYPLETPTTESVAGQTMNIPAGDSTIEITQASIDNLELEVTYEQEA